MTALTDRLQVHTQAMRLGTIAIDELLEQLPKDPFDSDSIEEIDEKKQIQERIRRDAARAKHDLLLAAAEIDGIRLGMLHAEQREKP